SQVSGSRATAVSFTGNGSLALSNNGSYDIAVYRHPDGVLPSAISFIANCSQNASSVGEFKPDPSSSSPNGTHYSFLLEDGTGRTYFRESYFPSSANASINALFEDGALLFLASEFSQAENKTSIHFTKSPGAVLILPFDSNDGGSFARDYSPADLQIASGSGIAEPQFTEENCTYGGCVLFNGEGQYLSINSSPIPERAVQYIPGVQRTADGELEHLMPGYAPNDYISDDWSNWTEVSNSNVSFLATNLSSLHGNALNISRTGVPSNDPRVYQKVFNMLNNVPYTLSFYSRGDGSSQGRYRIQSAHGYLQPGGAWGAGAYNFSTGVSSAAFQKVEVNFTLPVTDETGDAIFVELLPPGSDGYAIFDSVSLKRTEEANGGFEYFYYESGSSGSTFTSETSSGSTQGAAPYCWQKQCSTGADCTSGDAPFCNGGCNRESGACYPNLDYENICRFAGEACPGTPALECCGNAYCSSGTCVPKISCGEECASSGECALSCSNCAEPVGGGASTCLSCIPQESPSTCTSSAQCCNASGVSPGICDLGAASASFSHCVSCLPDYGMTCGSDSDCCTGACIAGQCLPNAAPYQPPAPIISPSQANQTTLISCIFNCPPSPIPADPQGDGPLLVSYKWFKNNLPVTSYWHNRTLFRCGEVACSAGNNITLQVRLCDSHGACTESQPSSPTTILSGSSPSCQAVSSACSSLQHCCQGLICPISQGQTSGSCCIPSNAAADCAANSECCSGRCISDPAVPGRNFCADLPGCGQSCTEVYSSGKEECPTSCPYCVPNTSGTSPICSYCISINEYMNCTSNSQCCERVGGLTGVCNLLPGSANYSHCVSCLPENHACISGTDCCTGACLDADGDGQRTCAPSSCGQEGASCSADSNCCPIPSAGSLFCDSLNRYPSPIEPELPGNLTFAGACTSCYPSFSKCDASNHSRQCCDSDFSCSLASGSTDYFCLPAHAIFATPVFYSWSVHGNASFSLVNSSVEPQHVKSGSHALSLSADLQVFQRHLASVQRLRGDKTYLLEFETASSGSSTGVRFAVHDSYNNAFLAPNGSWVMVRSPDGLEPVTPDIVQSTEILTSSLQHYAVAFHTLPDAKINLRFYPPDSGTGYLDEVSLTKADDFTFFAWVKSEVASPATPRAIFYQMGSENGTLQGIDWSISGSVLNATFRSAHALAGSSSKVASALFTLPPGEWHSVAVSVSRAGNYTSYLDGLPVSTGAFRLGRLNASDLFLIGKGNETNSGFKGALDEMRVYSRALSSQEVSRLHSAKYSLSCTISMKVDYSNFSQSEPRAFYNADLTLRSLSPSTLLSLPFEMNTSTPGSQIQDYSSSLLNCTLLGGEFISQGKFGNAYNFSSSGDGVSVNSSVISGSTDFTISLWAKPVSTSGTAYLAGNRGTGNPDGVSLELASGYPVLTIGAESITSSMSAPSGSWTHIVASRENGIGMIYVNSLNASTGALSGSIGNGTFTIGNSPNLSEPFSGAMDEVRAYNGFIGAQEITALYLDLGKSYSGTLPASPP
ncbi:MAG: hypothetical protein NT051_06835, partial [Candidatus Micrarchaeota archaeon]|nr:hypothetical protein [Candidatus Micrarchaeota archaeon]